MRVEQPKRELARAASQPACPRADDDNFKFVLECYERI